MNRVWIDGTEISVVVADNRNCTCPRSIKYEVVQLPAVLVIKGNYSISRRSQVVPTNAGAIRRVLIDGTEISVVVADNRNCTCPRTIKYEVVQLPAVFVIKGNYSIHM